ncbi:MAG TPA: hypothetical protein VHU17_17035, partial [Acidimicrobiales bacterium]|nr:hypothetical protein [Acidimicrobiales bacterium]
MPDPEDSVDEPSDEQTADDPYRGGETGPYYPDAGYQDAAGYREPVEQPRADHRYYSEAQDFSAADDEYADEDGD